MGQTCSKGSPKVADTGAGVATPNPADLASQEQKANEGSAAADAENADRFFDDDEDDGVPGLISTKDGKGSSDPSLREKYHPVCVDMAVNKLPFRLWLSSLTLDVGPHVGFADIKCKDIEGMEVRWGHVALRYSYKTSVHSTFLGKKCFEDRHPI
jgi:hypothetical protein